MLIIAHRGNVSGPNPSRENSPDYLLEAVRLGFDVELDVRLIDNTLWLGHDTPQYQIQERFLDHPSFWCHAKDLQTLEFLLSKKIRCFYHQNDDYTITSDGKIWAYPGKDVGSNTIAVMPEMVFPTKTPEEMIQASLQSIKNIDNALGVCTDYCHLFRKQFPEKKEKRNALLLIGQLRTFRLAYESLYKNVILPNKCDVFIYCSDPVTSRDREDLV